MLAVTMSRPAIGKPKSPEASGCWENRSIALPRWARKLVTADEVGDVGKLRISLRINGVTMQDSRTSQLIFGIAELVSYLSGVCTLNPGDLIYTGTPPGVGVARKPPVYLKPGDNVEVEIEKIGILRNPVIAEEVRL